MPATRPTTQFSLEEAVGASPSLAQLRERIQRSQACLAKVLPLLPAPLRPQVRSGPVDEDQWCLLVSSAAVSTKLRQLTPTLLQTLERHHMGIRHIRIKVQRPVD